MRRFAAEMPSRDFRVAEAIPGLCLASYPLALIAPDLFEEMFAQSMLIIYPAREREIKRSARKVVDALPFREVQQ
jgi:hypothetical protein